MVKRAKSPELPETDKYFTVYKPYPSNADFEVKEDYIACAKWIAAVIGPDPLHGMWWRPTARGMIILEIDKQYPYNERILGEHRWDDFLTKPDAEEKGKVSQIFHSFYAKGRDAQKDGWKRIHVESAWFQGWHPAPKILIPYPETHWCPVPKEDHTNKALCRPLPVKDKAPPPRTAKPVPGSSAWAQAKATAPPTKRALQGAWEQRKNEAQALAAGAGPENRAAWNKPITQNESARPPNAWSKGKPPLVTPAINSARGGVGQGKGKDYPAPPGLVKAPSSSSGPTNNTSSSAGGSGSGGMPDWTMEDDDDELPDISALAGRVQTFTISQSQQAILDGGDPYDDDPLIPEEHEVIQPWEREDQEDGPSASSVYVACGPEDCPIEEPDAANIIDEFEVYDEKPMDNTMGPWSTVGGNNNYEGDWAEPVSDKPAKLPASLRPCPFHPGRTCKKGICKWRAEEEKKEAREKREQEKRDQQAKRREEKKQAQKEERANAANDPEGAVSVSSGGGSSGGPRGRGRGWGRGRGRGKQ